MGAFTESVDPGGFIVQNLPDYIFLCGGKLDDYDHALRAHFYKQIKLTDPDLFKKIRLAEDADKWYRSRVLYKDLLELEEYVAGLSACILLFLESPGAIAELGVFSQTPNLKENLVVVIEESFYAEDSFIRHGPIERIEKTMPDNVWSYPWLTKSYGKTSGTVDLEISRTTLDSVIKDLREALEKHPKTCKFQHQDHGHRLLLIADLVKLDVACVVGELHKILDGIGLRIERELLNKYLYLLEKLGIIYSWKYGRPTYYISLDNRPDFIQYAPKKRNNPVDRIRLGALLQEEFPPSDDKKRAVREFKKRMGENTR